MFSSNSTHEVEAIDRFRNPFITLKDLTAVQFFSKYAPISCPVSSGFFLDSLRSGNTTKVIWPSNSLLVF